MLLSALTTCVLSAAPFVTSGMLRRNGLTDEQYQYLWSIGKNPKIDQAAARDWMFRASRFQNVTNWLELCGKTNDFAKLSFDLQNRNFVLTATNDMLSATNACLSAMCERLALDARAYWVNYTNQLAQTEYFSALYEKASTAASAATAKIDDEVEDLETKIEKYEGYKTKYPLLKTVWEALITDAKNRISVLQALTGS